MAINGTKGIDLDSHLVGDVSNWKSCIEEKWKESLPRPLPTRPVERRKTLVGTRFMVVAEVTRQSSEKPHWHTAEDLAASGRVRNLDKDGIDVAVLSPNSPALDLVWFPDDPELAAAYCRTQNNYMQQYANEFPERLRWAGVIPWQDRDMAV